MQRGQGTLAVEGPGSRWLQRVAAGTGLQLVAIPVDRDGLDVIALAATGARAVLCTPAHQFPTGAVLSSARRSALVRWAMDRLIIEDDHDGLFRWDRMPMGCVQGLDQLRVALLGSVSGPLAPGLRIGWVVPPPALPSTDTCAAPGRPTGRGGHTAERIGTAAADWAVAGAVAGLHVWLRPPGRVDAAALISAIAARGITVEVTAATTEGTALSGVVMSYARLDPSDAAEAAKRRRGP